MEMFVLSYVNVLCIYPKLCLLFRLMAQNLLDKTVCYTIVLLIYVNETICMVISLLQDSSQSFYGPRWILWCQDYPKIHLMDEGPGAILSFKTFLSFISRLLVTIYGEGNGNPLQYSCLENPMGGGPWKAAVHGVAKSWTRLSDFTFTFHCHALEKEMASHSSVLAWRIRGTAEPGGLPSMGSYRVGHDWSDTAAALYKFKIA